MTLQERLATIAKLGNDLHEQFNAFNQDMKAAQADAKRLDALTVKVADLDGLERSLAAQVQDLEAKRNAAITALAELKGRL